jgi:hypothetical protein
VTAPKVGVTAGPTCGVTGSLANISRLKEEGFGQVEVPPEQNVQSDSMPVLFPNPISGIPP